MIISYVVFLTTIFNNYFFLFLHIIKKIISVLIIIFLDKAYNIWYNKLLWFCAILYGGGKLRWIISQNLQQLQKKMKQRLRKAFCLKLATSQHHQRKKRFAIWLQTLQTISFIAVHLTRIRSHICRIF